VGGSKGDLCKNRWTDLNDLYVFLRKELPFGGGIDCAFITIFSGINFN